MVYKAHTIIQPFYSTVCLQYKSNLLDTASLSDIRNPIEKSITYEVFKTGKNYMWVKRSL